MLEVSALGWAAAAGAGVVLLLMAARMLENIRETVNDIDLRLQQMEKHFGVGDND